MKSNTPKDLINLEILYVEDEEIIREPFTEMLKRRVKRVVSVNNGLEGLKMFQARHFDLIITDIKMQEMSGLEMAAEIRKSSPFIPIIVTTAYDFKDYLHKSIELGINKYLVKPIQKETLLLALNEICRILSFKQRNIDHQEFFNLLLGFDNKIIIWATLDSNLKINSDFLSFFGFSSREDFYRQFDSPIDFFIENRNKTFQYNAAKSIQWIDSFMKLNGVERNTIMNMSGTSALTEYNLHIRVFAKNTKIAIILQPYTI